MKPATLVCPLAAANAAIKARRKQAELRHDQEPFRRVLERAEELERARWPVQGDPGDERPEPGEVLQELAGPFGRLALSRFKL